ncbi:MAG: PEP-CTERM sorting domain-containing protein [Phycisphaerae bacterium]|nr:PEP-CTERM sorting domain-containing protein [Phycisphaerae bacterium]
MRTACPSRIRVLALLVAAALALSASPLFAEPTSQPDESSLSQALRPGPLVQDPLDMPAAGGDIGAIGDLPPSPLSPGGLGSPIPVPEPATALFLATGSLVLLGASLRRRARRKHQP